jgi:tetratricopeptide (TPR) repeat protein
MFLLGCLLMGCQPNGPKALLEGQDLINQGKYTQAIQRLKTASELIPQNPQVWNYLGLAYHGNGNGAEAATAYQRALSLDRNLSPVYFNLGNLYLEENKLAESIATLSTFTVLQPNNADGWIKLGTAQLRARRPDEAEKSLHRALALSPRDPEVQNDLGLVHLQRKRPREAMQAFNLAIQYQTNYAPAVLNQAIVAQYQFGTKATALERYHRYLALRPDQAIEINPVIKQLESELAPKTLPVTNSIAQMLAARRTNAAPTNLAQTANLTTNEATKKPELNTNLALLAQIAQIKSNLSVITNRANPPVKAPEPAPTPAMVATEKTNQIPSPPATTATNIAKAPTTTTNNVANAATPTPAPKTAEPPPEPEQPVQVVSLNSEPAIKPAQDLPAPTAPAITNSTLTPSEKDQSQPVLEPENRPLFAPRKTHKDSGVIDKLNPTGWFRKNEPSAKPAPTPPSPARKEQTPVQLANNNSAPPVQIEQPKPPPQKQFPRFPYRKNLSFPAGNRTEAKDWFSQAAREHQERRWAPAIEHYKKSIQADSSYFEAHYNLALAAYQSGDLPLALAAGEEAVALKPGSIDARYNFALILRDANYFVDATDQLRELLVDSPDEVRAHYMLANLYAQQLDEPTLAARHYQKVLDADPKHPEASRIRYWLANHQ